MDVEQVARVCHETNRGYCESIGDNSQKPWNEAEESQRESARAGVRFALDNPSVPASAQHDSWLDEKLKDGWRYGPVKNPVKKEHPCIVPYINLSPEQRMKDYLFRAIVWAFVEAEKELSPPQFTD